jgi:CRP-like cAMP-binding protein
VPFDDTVFLKRNVDVLSFFTEDQLRKVTINIERQIYKTGHTVVFQGEISDNFYIVKKGNVSVSAKGSAPGSVPLGMLKAGDFFGEMSLLEAMPSNATIRSLSDDTEILMIPHDSFQLLLRDKPQLEMALRERMAERRRQREERLKVQSPPPPPKH